MKITPAKIREAAAAGYSVEIFINGELYEISEEPAADPDKLKETAARFYNFMEPWERCDTTPEETAEEISKNPLDAINYLLDMLEG